MKKKILKWAGIVVGGFLMLLLGMYVYISMDISQRTGKQYYFAAETLAIPADSASLALGKHLVNIKGCTDCHGENLEGKVMVQDAMLGTLAAANLTKGPGGLPADYTTEDWVMALRHGITKGGRPLLFMPSHETTLLSEKDMAAIIAYCQQLKPVESTLPAFDLGPVVKVMTFLDKMPLLSVEKIDHTASFTQLPETLTAVEHGQYLAISCKGCHGENMRGGGPLAPGMPPVPDITSSGAAGKWTKSQFINTLRTGKTPTGHQMSPDNMPWTMTAKYKEEELLALYEYLHSIK